MNELYNEKYYENYCIPYEDNEYWMRFFNCIAKNIVRDFQPRTVLDAGCAMGYLVAALRDLGVKAYGMDISEYAISRVREDIKPFCIVSSLAEPLPDCIPKRYDLVVTIEVLEHLNEDDGRAAVVKLCSYADRILFSSTPNDFKEISHINVQQKEYWTKLFAQEGFLNELNYTPDYIAPYAVSYIKNDNMIGQVADYERVIRLQNTAYQELYQASVFSKIVSKGKLYLDTGNGYNEEEVIELHQDWLQHKLSCKLDLPAGVRKVRFDPVEGIACIINNISFLTDLGSIQYNCNGMAIDEYILFSTDDPQFEIDFNGNSINFLEIKGDIAFLNDMTSILYSTKIIKYKGTIIETGQRLTELEQKLVEIDGKLSETENKLIAAENRLEAKDENIQYLEDIIRENEEKAVKNESELKSQLDNALAMYNAVIGSTCWKLTKPVRSIGILIKRMLKSFTLGRWICKGLSCWRRHGFRYTCKKVVLKIKNRAKQAECDISQDIKISVLVPLFNTPEKFLREMIESVICQTYGNWELCIVNGSDSKHDYVHKICLEYGKHDERICYKLLNENLGISKNTNACAVMAKGDYIALLDHDDVLNPQALYENAKAIKEAGADILYSDEDHIDNNGQHVNPFYKPDWSIDLLYSQMYIGHLLVVKKQIFEKTGGFRDLLDGSQDYDLMLRLSELTQFICHIPKILYSWRESQASTAANAEAKPYAQTSGQRALDDHLKRKYGTYARGADTSYKFVYEARFDTMSNKPKVSIIIPMKDKWELSDACISSIINVSTYQNYEILVLNNNSVREKTFKWFEEIQKRDSRIKVINADMPFNWSRLNNFGMKAARGEVYVFLNNDTVIITPEWIEKLCENALRDDIGLVGPLLLYEDGTIQHAGVVVGMGGWANHVFNGMKPVHYGTPFVSPMVSRNVLAVTGACMAVSKKTIEKIGNFDEEFTICGSDVELGIRSHEYGLNNLYNPRVELYHLESKSRDSYIPENDFNKSYDCYSFYRENGDPYYNINLDKNNTHPTKKEEPSKEQAADIHYKNYIKRISRGKFQKVSENTSASYVDYEVSEVRPICARPSIYPGAGVRLNLIVPSIDKKHVYGGIATALKLFHELAENKDIDTRIIVTDASIDLNNCIKLNGYKKVNCNEDSNYRKEVIDLADRENKIIPVRKNDIFIATAWWTAYMISKLIIWQAQEYHMELNKLIYLVQDYEPGFYPWSTRYLLADSTYRLNIPTIAIFNSKLLNEYFNDNGYTFYKSYYIEPVLNSVLRSYLMDNQGRFKRKKQILIYGRPSTERNAFELIVGALREWCKTQKNVQEWTILSAGEMHPDIHLFKGVKIHALGKLGLREYGEIMLKSYIGLSIMVSPHPSYPPLEMSTFGLKTITNQYGNKNLTDFNPNIISLEVCSQEIIAATLNRLCDNFNANGKIYINDNYINHEDVYEDIAKKIWENLNE